MSVLPDWNSIESTSRWSDILFWAGIICLVLLAATEVASHIYGSRSGFLSGETARHTEEQHRQEENTAEARRKAEVEGLQKQLADAGKKVTNLETQQIPRRLSILQKNQFLAALAPFGGQKYTVSIVSSGSNEPSDLANDLIAVLDRAKWKMEGAVAFMMIAGTQPIGVEVKVNPQDANDQSPIRPALGVLVIGLVNMGLMPGPNVSPADAPPGTISITIGLKPSAP